MRNLIIKLQTADFILIILTFTMSILSFYCILMPRGLEDDLVNKYQFIENDWAVTIDFNSSQDSLIIQSLKNRLSATADNDSVRQILSTLVYDDTNIHNALAKIISINGVFWKPMQLSNDKWRKNFLRELQDSPKDHIEFDYNGVVYHAELDHKPVNSRTADGIASRLIILWLVLLPALSLNVMHRRVFILIFFIRMIALILECANAFIVEDFFLINAYTYFIIIADLVLYIPIGKIVHKHNKVLSYVLIAALLFLSFGRQSSFRYVPYILSLAFAIFKQKGINRRFFRKYLYNFISLLAVMIVGVMIHNFLNFSDSYPSFYSNDRVWIITGYWNYLMMMICYRMVILALYFSLMYRVLHLRVEMIERIFTWLIASVFVVIFSNILIDIFIIFKSYVQWEIPALVLAVLVAVYTINKLIRTVPLFSPVRFSVRDKGMQVLEKSYSFIDPVSYSEYFIGELNKLYPKVKSTIYTDNFIAGSSFPGLSPDMIKSLGKQVGDEIAYINVDVEILNNTGLAKMLDEFDQSQMPHLLYFIRDRSKLVALLAMGRMYGTYWHSSLSKALNVLVDVYRGFFLGILRQQDLIQNSILLDREAEARAYNEKMIKLTTEANERLTEEKMKMAKSIDYASLIQKSILPQPADMAAAFKEHFVIWKPRDVLGGDFYWLHQTEEGNTFLAVIDCTGHGVPAALLTMTVNSLLNNLIRDKRQEQLGQIMEAMHEEIGKALHQEQQHTQQDGFEIALIKWDTAKDQLAFCGAGLNLLYKRPGDDTLQQLRGEKHGIGGLKWHKERVYTEQVLHEVGKMRLYLYTDGILDQLDARDDKLLRFGHQGWLQLVGNLAEYSLQEQLRIIEDRIKGMLNVFEQRDDITVLGITLG